MYDPSSGDKKATKKEMVLYAPKKPIKGDVFIQIVFGMPYPKKWFRTGKYNGILKNNAPLFHSNKPDIDNMVKFYLDCMSGIIYNDDKQVVWLTTYKKYSITPSTKIKILERDEVNITDLLQAEQSQNN